MDEVSDFFVRFRAIKESGWQAKYADRIQSLWETELRECSWCLLSEGVGQVPSYLCLHIWCIFYVVFCDAACTCVYFLCWILLCCLCVCACVICVCVYYLWCFRYAMSVTPQTALKTCTNLPIHPPILFLCHIRYLSSHPLCPTPCHATHSLCHVPYHPIRNVLICPTALLPLGDRSRRGGDDNGGRGNVHYAPRKA